jgi:hypothetical protein
LASLDCQGGVGNFAGLLIHNNGVTVTISAAGAAAFRLSPQMSYNGPTSGCLLTFTNTSGVAMLTSAGKKFGAITINGAGGTVRQADDLSVNTALNSPFTVTAGTFDANGFNTTAISFLCSGAGVRTVLLGATLNLGGNTGSGATVFTTATSTNLTFTVGACVINVVSTGGASYVIMAFSALTYNAINFQTTSAALYVSLTGSPTFSNFNVAPGWVFYLPGQVIGSPVLTVQNAFALVGSPTLPVGFVCTAVATFNFCPVSCPSGNCSIQWGILSACTGIGGANFSATDTLAVGLNTGWAITPPIDASIPAAVASAVWGDLLSSSDFTVAGSAGALMAAMANLQYTVPAIGRGTTASGGTRTSIPTSAFAPATSASVANQLVGRAVLFDAATATVALRGQAAVISASSAAAAPTLTVSTLTAAPASGDTFSVV